MGNRPVSRVRVALGCVLALLTAGLVVPNVAAQFARPGGPVAPPGMPGGNGGGFVPPGLPGGVRPNFPQPVFPQPNFPKPPDIPRPNFDVPRMPDLPGPGGFGGGFRQPESVWTCGKCKSELARGPVKPALESCPVCGVHFINGGGGMVAPEQPDFGGMRAPVPGGDLNVPNPQEFPPLRAGVPGEFKEPDLGGWKADFARDQEDEQKRLKAEEKERASARGMIWTVVGVVAGLSVLLVIGLVLLAILSQSSRKKAARRSTRRKPKRRVSRYDDDDDDDDEYIPRSKRRRYD